MTTQFEEGIVSSHVFIVTEHDEIVAAYTTVDAARAHASTDRAFKVKPCAVNASYPVNEFRQCGEHGTYTSFDGRCPICRRIAVTTQPEVTNAEFDAMMAEAEPAELITPASVRRLDVKPNEALLVSLPDDITQEHFARVAPELQRAFERALPDTHVIIVNRDVELTVIASGAHD